MQSSGEIKCGFCVAYDWELLANSIPPIYKYCNTIVIAVDQNCISWNGTSFQFDEDRFYLFIKSIDPENKIKIYREIFFIPDLSPAQNEIRQRNLLADYMGKGGWHLQIDSDEYILNPELLFNTIDSFRNSTGKVTIRCQWITLFKYDSEGFFIVKNNPLHREFVAFATNDPLYVYGRNNGCSNYYTNCLILHQSWARSEDEIVKKIDSWGHTKDVDFTSFKNGWLLLNIGNYKSYKNLHPLKPAMWQSLERVEADSIQSLIKRSDWGRFKMASISLGLKNSKVLAKIRQTLNV